MYSFIYYMIVKEGIQLFSKEYLVQVSRFL